MDVSSEETRKRKVSSSLFIKIKKSTDLKSAAELLRHSPNCSKLVLEFTPGVTIGEADLQTILELPLKLSSLEIIGNGLEITGSCFSLNGPTSLTTLILQGLPRLNDERLQLLMLRNPNLYELSVTECNGLGQFQVPSPDHFPNGLCSLSRLCLENTNVSDRSLTIIMTQAPDLQFLSLKKCPYVTGLYAGLLQKLYFANLVDLASFRSEGLKDLLTKTPYLRELEVERCPGITEIDRPGLLALPMLEKLRLDSLEALRPASLLKFLNGLRPERDVKVILKNGPITNNSHLLSTCLSPRITVELQKDTGTTGYYSSLIF
jgi:hypothetical protein